MGYDATSARIVWFWREKPGLGALGRRNFANFTRKNGRLIGAYECFCAVLFP
jgi:hypothetical protein